ncbi:MAG TPA: D-aminoacylase, partial [Planctomycetaceae bacterium]|nr:D-aminoacylase [Planctomycetaceae bacterium]
MFRFATWCFLFGSGIITTAVDSLPTARADNGPAFDIVIRGGLIVDGTGGKARRADLGIRGDTIAAIGDLSQAKAGRTIDATNLVVAPGFINMLSWASDSLIADGRGQSDILQGVTLEVMGEGWSYGPYNEALKKRMIREQGDIKYPIPWTTLSQYLEHLVERGVSPNVASFVGATTVRAYVVGFDNRKATKEELDRMCELVRHAMEEGALGVASALIYAPGFYADTEELIALARVAAKYDGTYISHLRSEGNRLLEAVDEFLRIAREADIEAQIYHLKAAGKANEKKLDQVIAKIEAARGEGLGISADIYTYTAGATGLDAAMPPWVQEGGLAEWKKRLQDPEIRKRVAREMRTPTDQWENLLLMAGSPERVILVGFKSDKLKPLTGKTLAEVAKLRGTSVEETAMDLVVEDDSRIECVYFLMSEENVKKKICLPWVSICSDAG